MKYFIKRVGQEKYIQQFPQFHWVDNIEKATGFKNLETVKNGIGQTFKNFLGDDPVEIVSVDKEVSCNAKPLDSTEAEEIYDSLKSAFDLLRDATPAIAELVKYLATELSRYDLMQEDILHKLELDEVSGLTAIHLAKQLKEVRINRRKAKDKLTFCKQLGELHIADVSKRMQNFQTGMENRKYNPRVLTELFEEDYV